MRQIAGQRTWRGSIDRKRCLFQSDMTSCLAPFSRDRIQSSSVDGSRTSNTPFPSLRKDSLTDPRGGAQKLAARHQNSVSIPSLYLKTTSSTPGKIEYRVVLSPLGSEPDLISTYLPCGFLFPGNRTSLTRNIRSLR